MKMSGNSGIGTCPKCGFDAEECSSYDTKIHFEGIWCLNLDCGWFKSSTDNLEHPEKSKYLDGKMDVEEITELRNEFAENVGFDSYEEYLEEVA
jgi:hypothetical protein